jgi:hypothetical protein
MGVQMMLKLTRPNARILHAALRVKEPWKLTRFISSMHVSDAEQSVGETSRFQHVDAGRHTTE